MLSWTVSELVSAVGIALLFGIAILKLKFAQFLFGGKKKKEEAANGDIPDGSMGWPLIGETLAFLQPHNSNTIGIFLQQRSSKYTYIYIYNFI